MDDYNENTTFDFRRFIMNNSAAQWILIVLGLYILLVIIFACLKKHRRNRKGIVPLKGRVSGDGGNMTVNYKKGGTVSFALQGQYLIIASSTSGLTTVLLNYLYATIFSVKKKRYFWAGIGILIAVFSGILGYYSAVAKLYWGVAVGLAIALIAVALAKNRVQFGFYYGGKGDTIYELMSGDRGSKEIISAFLSNALQGGRRGGFY